MDVITLRRDFHRHPETAFTEFRTASKVVKILRSLGYSVLYGEEAMDCDVRKKVPPITIMEEAMQRALRDGADPEILQKMNDGLTAVIGILKGKKDGPVISFRFDMDALPITESDDLAHLPAAAGFRSQYEGFMHACGHDAHTAIGLALAERMVGLDFEGTLKLIFQPAEEGGWGGANSIVSKGIVDDVDKLFCLHLTQSLPLGSICGGSTGWMATTKMEAHFYGVSSHAGTAPEKGRNALLGAATALLNIHAQPRFNRSETRVNVGVLEGGTASNIIPDHAKMIIETRASDEEINKDLEKRVKSIIKHSAEMHDLNYEIKVTGEATTIYSDSELVNLVLEEARKISGFSLFQEIGDFGGSDDGSFLIRRVQERGGKATYMLIGSPMSTRRHSPNFDVDERTLPMTVELLLNVAKRVLFIS
jgi:aminobenzoyl-glutamate utilization protein A